MKLRVFPLQRGFMLDTTNNSSLSILVRNDGELEFVTSKSSSTNPAAPGTGVADDISNTTEEAFVDALLGIVRGVTKGTFYLMVVTKSTPVGSRTLLARSVDEVQLIPFPGGKDFQQKCSPDTGDDTDDDTITTLEQTGQQESTADRLHVQFIERAIHNIPFLYFSHTRDIVHSVQAQHTTKSLSIRDSMFVWNWKFLLPLLDANVPKEWIHPLIQGLVAIKENVKVLDLSFDLALITRRAVTHQGTRFNCRGLDSNGHAANFCETEQLLLFRNDREGTVASFVLVRGSLPTTWKQQCSLIPVNQRARADTDWASRGLSLFLKHLQTQMAKYGKQQVFVNLVDRKGKTNSSADQALLGKVFESHVGSLSSATSFTKADGVNTPVVPPKYVWFDFHHETKETWENLSRLLRDIQPEIKGMGFFLWSSTNPALSSVQTGCFRVNCMDNLDRTNVVQSIIARASLIDQLSRISNQQLVQSPTTANLSVFDSGFADLEQAFKPLWADNADAVSLVYAGSYALKTDFTRTGKRSLVGKVLDGINSTTRLVMNNLFDAWRQDEIDVLLREDRIVHDLIRRLALERQPMSTQWWGGSEDLFLGAKLRWGFLALLTLGYFTPLGGRESPHQYSYIVALVAFAAYVVTKQTKERPRLSRH